MVPGTGRELDFWTLDLGVGFGAQAGNTEQLSLNSTVDVERTTISQRGGVHYIGNLATQNNDVSANNHRVTTQYDVYLTRRFFVNVARFEFFHDQFQNITWRVTPSVGVGYDLLWSATWKWQLGAGVGYQAVRYDSVAVGPNQRSNFPVLVNSRFDIDLTNRFEWKSVYQLQLITTDTGSTNQHLTSTLSFDFWGPLDFDTTFQWDWIADPNTDQDGAQPQASDFRLTAGFTISL
jgi:putative salt-induced outer membrane protein YdiY